MNLQGSGCSTGVAVVVFLFWCLKERSSALTGCSKIAAVLVVAALIPGPRAGAQVSSNRDPEVQQLRELVLKLQSRVDQLEAERHPNSAGQQVAPGKQPESEKTIPDSVAPTVLITEDRGALDFFKSTTLNFGLDGYYGYNFNQPIGQVNILRAYDVSSNSFSLNQANFIVERTPDTNSGRRFGVRVDFQYGQATETVQGSAANELRPQVYRPLWQAYGTYVFPVGSGLTVDFGKWASALGPEGNYSKDQINYSRSYYFHLLPFYHMGLRATYSFMPKVTYS
jgi:hypothetical protein